MNPDEELIANIIASVADRDDREVLTELVAVILEKKNPSFERNNFYSSTTGSKSLARMHLRLIGNSHQIDEDGANDPEIIEGDYSVAGLEGFGKGGLQVRVSAWDGERGISEKLKELSEEIKEFVREAEWKARQAEIDAMTLDELMEANAEAEEEGPALNEREVAIKNQVELRLSQSGIKVHEVQIIICGTEEEKRFFIYASPFTAGGKLVGYAVSLTAERLVTFKANGKPYVHSATVWNETVIAPKDGLTEHINELMDQFLSDYHKANPKKED